MRTEDGRSTGTESTPLIEARQRRQDLHAMIVALEVATARAAGQPQEWAERVHEALIELGAEFERHMATTEAPGGLFEAINSAAPRLANQVGELVREHQDIRAAIGAAMDAIRPQAHPFGRAEASGGRDAVLALLNRLLRHRQAGADLVYEAFETDIGVGD